jgi:hypothetical protein
VTDPAVIAQGGYTIKAIERQAFASFKVATFVDPAGAEPNADDPDPALSHHYTATIDWGDATSSEGLISQSAGVFVVQGSHAYSEQGSYPITVTVHHESAAPAVAQSAAIVSYGAGILLLDPKGCGALTVTDRGSVDIGASGVMVVDSSNRQAVTLGGFASVTTAEVDVVGGVKKGAGARLQGDVQKTARVAAPLSLPLPLAPAKSYKAVRYIKRGTLTLNPGTYVGGIQLGGNSTVYLNPGVYYMKGGGFKVSGNARVFGDGVIIVNAPQKACDTISFADNAIVNLSAPTSLPGPYAAYAGIALFQKPTASVPITLQHHSAVTLQGEIYAPRAALTIQS